MEFLHRIFLNRTHGRTPGHRMRSGRICPWLLAVILSLAPRPTAAEPEELPDDFTELSIEELMNVTVTLVSRKEENLAQAPAAIAVISSEDIRRSGVTSIAEALRLVPGVQVARIDANKWAITARGFNLRFANKLLVQIDGRSVYTPLFSGVYWEAQDLMLEDVERIEVIRGPGATLWGANAVNGIINIITRQAQDTQGSLARVGGGSEERAFGQLRYGGRLGEELYYRVYAKYFDRDQLVDAAGTGTGDAWNTGRGGFRLDWKPREDSAWTLQGDLYDGELSNTVSLVTLEPPHNRSIDDEVDFSGGNLLGRWQRNLSTTSDLALQVYYDRTARRDIYLEETRNTFDLDFQHRFGLVRQHETVWGLGYRFSGDDTEVGLSTIAIDPPSRQVDRFSGFVQDDITLVDDRLRLMIGSKFEHNDYSGFEVQPSVRLLWKPRPHHTLWSAFSRAVRTPSRIEENIGIPHVTQRVVKTWHPV